MMPSTNDPALRTFVPVAAESHFPIQNLPYGVFQRVGDPLARQRIGVAIGDCVLDLSVLEERGFFNSPALAGRHLFLQPTLNAFMAAGRSAWQQARAIISRLLRHDEPTLRDDVKLRDVALLPMSETRMLLPAAIGDYTDFYSSREHATNVGTMLRGPENALPPQWLYLPIAYHGRASSIVLSGTSLRRPLGQSKADDAAEPSFGPSRAVDFELELGVFVGPGNELGHPIPITAAAEHLFGMVLVNDWSARDLQKWEYMPLGPFLAKNFGTSISPWIVPLEALSPFRVPGPVQQPEPLPYLRCAGDSAYDIHLEVYLRAENMPRPERIAATNSKHLYWTVAQQLAHHTSNGCNLRPGDLLASGTISGPTPDSYGSLLELAWKGARPLRLSNGETRVFLQDGDEITLTGWCQGQGYRIGFGEVTGRIEAAQA